MGTQLRLNGCICPYSRQPAIARSYATESESAKAAEGVDQPGKTSAPSGEPAATDLEAKDKEIIELKVCCH